MIEPEKKSAPTSAGRLAFLDEGSGPAVVLLHGSALSSYQWRHLRPLLASRFRVIALDLLGAGDSEKPADAALGIAAQAGYVAEALTGLDVRRFAVVGHGSGGGIAQLLALDHEGVEAMVLIDSVAFDEWPRVGAAREPAALEGDATIRSLVREAFDVGMRQRSRLSDQDLAEYVRPWRGAGGAAAYLRALQGADGGSLLGREGDLNRLEIPVLILWGEDDPFFAADVPERLSDALPTSTLGLLPGCGHFLTEEAPETIGPMILEYLRARYAGAPHAHEGIATIQLERRPPWIGEEEEDM